MAVPVQADSSQEQGEDGEHDPMNGIGFGAKIGLGVVAAQKLTSASAGAMGTGTMRGNLGEKQTDSGMAVGVPLYLGDGHGFALTLEFFYWRIKEQDKSTGDTHTIQYTGGQFAMGGQWQLANPLYLFVGIGPRAGAVHGGGQPTGAHLAARLPVTFTLYPANMLGFTAEFGLGYGGTARAQASGSGSDANASTEWVSGFLFDLTLGMRFP